MDNDRTAALLGKILRVETLLILTDVEKVCLDYNRPGQRPIDRATLKDRRKFLEEGQFPAGSVGSEIESAIKFLESGGSGVMISPLEMAEGVLIERAGTTVFALPSLLGPTNGSTPPV